MAFLRKIKAGLVKTNIATFVGEEGNIFFNVDTGQLRLGDGFTPGGLPINTSTVVASTQPASPNTGDLWFDAVNGTLSIFYLGNWNNVGGNIDGFTNNNNNTIILDAGYNIEPATDGSQNLGSPTKKFGSLYLSGQTLYIDTTRISVNEEGEITFTDDQDDLIAVHVKELRLGGEETTVLRRSESGGLEMVLNHGQSTQQTFSLAVGYTGSQGAPGSIGVNSINTASDVDVTNLQDGSVLVYANNRSKWQSTINLNKQSIDGGEF